MIAKFLFVLTENKKLKSIKIYTILLSYNESARSKMAYLYLLKKLLPEFNIFRLNIFLLLVQLL